jgi:multicomponent K+:H+ antiporter subunit G
MIEVLISLLLLIGAAFLLVGAIGLARLPDIFMRLHGPTKATTLGIGALVVASVVHSGTLAPLVVMLFLFITAPVVAHVVALCAQKPPQEQDDTSD